MKNPEKQTIQRAEQKELAALAVELAVTSARFTRYVAREAGGDVPRALWRLMGVLDEIGAARTTDLALADRTSQPTMTASVQRLEERGWVSRVPDPEDGRASLVSLTTAGREALALERYKAGVALAPRIAHISASDRDLLRRGIEIIRELMAE